MKPDGDSPEALEDEPTHPSEMAPLDDLGWQTRGYKNAEFLAGHAAGVKEGVDITIAALKVELVHADCREGQIKNILARVRGGTANRS